MASKYGKKNRYLNGSINIKTENEWLKLDQFNEVRSKYRITNLNNNII